MSLPQTHAFVAKVLGPVRVNGAEMSGNEMWSLAHPSSSSNSAREGSVKHTARNRCQHQHGRLRLNACLQTMARVEFVSADARKS